MTRTLVVWLFIAACGGAPVRSPAERAAESAPSVAALQASKFEDASRLAGEVLARDPKNARAAAVRAIASYVAAGHTLVRELGQVIEQAGSLKAFDHAGGRAAWQRFLDQLAVIDRDLAVVSEDASFALELCLACWERDWNNNGRVDDRDRKLFELEYDGAHGELAEGDPRRRPTFRFDVGDADWARAMIAFQRAFGELVLAYRWSELDLLFGSKDPPGLTIKLGDRDRVVRARELIVKGLGHADRCRRAYLAETDDDREWVPNPKQRSHPLPLEADEAVYRTWEGVLGDVRRMLASEEGISIRAAAALIDDDLVAFAPDAYLDLGKLLGDPADIVIDLSRIDERKPSVADVERILRGLFQHGYQTGMKPTPLLARLATMKKQLDEGNDTFERKLRYLLWLN